MDFENIFTVKKEHLDLLTEDTAVEFFKRLLWAEARRLGPGTCKINVPSETKIPDGGIDATADASSCAQESDIISRGKNGYQIRSGTVFKPWRDGDIRKELLKQGSPKVPKQEHLRESIRDCLDECGTYVLVCTGIDRLVPPYRKKAFKLISDYLKACGYPNAKVDIWSQNILIRFLKSFPSFSLWVNGRDSAKFQTHDSWSRDANMQGPFIFGESQDKFIENLRSDLRRDDYTNPVLVSGHPGIGKTRLVLETTRTEDLAPLVIYSPADQFLQDKFLMDELCNSESDFSAIVVIDDCNLHSRSEILNKLKYRGAKIKLIVIYNNHEEIAGDISPYVPPRLSDEQICSIIADYTQSSDTSDMRWVELCSGSPRVAHVVGWNLANYPQDVLNPLSTINIWERYIVSVDDPSQERTEQRRRVLRFMALFKQFGFEAPVGEEAEVVARKINEADPQITWTIFQEVVDNLKKRKILQGKFTLSITPKALHIKLWTEWWDIYGRGFDLEEFKQGLTPKLVEWFYEMFRYAATSGVASTVVKDLLGTNGPFQKRGDLQTNHDGDFFLALTEADPDAALECLQNSVKTWGGDAFSKFVGRTYVLSALEKIVVWRHLFVDAARLLLTLGDTKFADLFSLGQGTVAPTAAPPEERFPVLKEAFESGLKEHRALAMKACNVALVFFFFSRTGSPEYQGLSEKPKLWLPKTEGEFWDAYKRVWKLLVNQLEHLSEDERKDGVDILLGHAPGLSRIPNLAEMIVETVALIAKRSDVNKKQVIKTVNAILHNHGERLPAETLGRWEQLMDELVTPDFHSMMRRYVGMDLLEDLKLEENQNYVDYSQPRIAELAQRAVDSPSLLQSELYWLVTVEAQNGYRYGFELGKMDDGFRLLPTLLDAQRNTQESADVGFLGGYFRAIFESDSNLWERQLKILSHDAALSPLIPRLTCFSGMTNHAGLHLLDLAQRDVIGINDFKPFTHATVINNLTDDIFRKWIEYLLNVSNKAATSIALQLYYRYYIFPKRKSTLPLDLTFQLLCHPPLFEESDKHGFDATSQYNWAEIGKVILHLNSEKSLELLEPMLRQLGKQGTVFERLYEEALKVLDKITSQYPSEVWEQVSKILEDRTDYSRIGPLEQWLREGRFLSGEDSQGALAQFPRKKIWEWVDEDLQDRAAFLAGSFIPKTFSAGEWPTSLTRAFLVRYGERAEVCRNLCTNYVYCTEGWYGSENSYYEEKLKSLRRIRDGEDNENVKRWIDELIDRLNKQNEDEELRHERMPY